MLFKDTFKTTSSLLQPMKLLTVNWLFL